MSFKTWLREFARRLKSPPAIIGGGIVIFYIIIALLAPVLAPPQYADPFMIPKDGFYANPLPPSGTPLTIQISPRVNFTQKYAHPFGTTKGQYDIYYGCIWGTINAFRMGFSVVFGALAIGFLIGHVAGLLGGIIDQLIMRFTDIFLLLPSFIFAMALVVVLYPVLLPIGISRLDIILLALILFGGVSYARIVRGEILRIKHEDYTKASEDIGYHPATDLIYPFLIMPLLDIGLIVSITASLSFLGLGPPEGYADWGQLIAFSRNYIVASPTDPFRYWYTFVIPGLFIFTFVLGWVLLSDAFRDILDPIRRR